MSASVLDFSNLDSDQPTRKHSIRLASIISTDETWGHQALEKYRQTMFNGNTDSKISEEPDSASRKYGDAEKGAENESTTATQYWLNGDRAMRICMVFIGLLSGLPSPIGRPALRTALSVYHILMSCFLTATVVIEIRQLTLSDVTYTSELGAVTQLIRAVWSVQVVICTWLMLISCQKKSGLITFYERLANCVRQATACQLKEKSGTYKTTHQLFVSMALILALLLGLPVHYNVITTTQITGFTALDYVRVVGGIILTAHWSFLMAFILSLTFTNYYLFAKLGKRFRRDAKKSAQIVADQLNIYRTSHLRLMKLYSCASSSLSLILEVTMAGTITTWLLVIRSSVLKTTDTSGLSWYLHIGCYLPPTTPVILLIVIFSEKTTTLVSLVTVIDRT